MTDVKLDDTGQVVAARDIAKGETISIPLELYELIARAPTRAVTQEEIDAAKPGDVLADGTIMTVPAGGHAGYPVGRGIVYVTSAQTDQAARYGWWRVDRDDKGEVVQIAR